MARTLIISRIYIRPLKEKERTIQTLLTRVNEKREKIYELRDIIKSQRDKDIRSILDPNGANN